MRNRKIKMAACFMLCGLLAGGSIEAAEVSTENASAQESSGTSAAENVQGAGAAENAQGAGTAAAAANAAEGSSAAAGADAQETEAPAAADNAQTDSGSFQNEDAWDDLYHYIEDNGTFQDDRVVVRRDFADHYISLETISGAEQELVFYINKTLANTDVSSSSTDFAITVPKNSQTAGFKASFMNNFGVEDKRGYVKQQCSGTADIKTMSDPEVVDFNMEYLSVQGVLETSSDPARSSMDNMIKDSYASLMAEVPQLLQETGLSLTMNDLGFGRTEAESAYVSSYTGAESTADAAGTEGAGDAAGTAGAEGTADTAGTEGATGTDAAGTDGAAAAPGTEGTAASTGEAQAGTEETPTTGAAETTEAEEDVFDLSDGMHADPAETEGVNHAANAADEAVGQAAENVNEASAVPAEGTNASTGADAPGTGEAAAAENGAAGAAATAESTDAADGEASGDTAAGSEEDAATAEEAEEAQEEPEEEKITEIKYEFEDLVGFLDTNMAEGTRAVMQTSAYYLDGDTLKFEIDGTVSNVPLTLVSEDADDSPVDIGPCNHYLVGAVEYASDCWISNEKMIVLQNDVPTSTNKYADLVYYLFVNRNPLITEDEEAPEQTENDDDKSDTDKSDTDKDEDTTGEKKEDQDS